MTTITTQEYRFRIETLKQFLIEKKIDAAVLSQSSDLYYYSGSVLPQYCIIPARGESFLLARKSIDRISHEAAHIPVERFSGTKDLAAIWKSHSLDLCTSAGYALDSTSYATTMRIHQLFTNAAINDLSMDLRYLRMIKSPSEIEIHTRAGKIIAGFPSMVKEHFKPGMTELELSAHIEHYFRVNGMGVVNSKQEALVLVPGVCSAGINSLAGNKFDGICSGTGVNAAIPFGSGNHPIPSGVPIIMDYAFVLEGYHVDMTRMASVGKPSAIVIKAYNAMLEIEKAVIDAMKPGKQWSEIYELSVKMADNLGYTDEYMGFGPDKVRFVGHGVGLQLDEPPYLAQKMTQPLAAGMVIAVEPKVSLRNIGVVGIENTYLVGNDGVTLLTDCSDEIIIL